MFPECQKDFSFIELSRMTGSITFSNEVMDKLGSYALEEEKNFLPQRQKYAKQKIEEKKYLERSKERTALRQVIGIERQQLITKINAEIANNPKYLEYNKKISDLQNQINILKIEKNAFHKTLTDDRDIKSRIFDDKINDIYKEEDKDRTSVGMITETKNNYKFIKQCVYDSCKGFLEDNQGEEGWKCSLCDNFTCRRCHEPLIKKENDKGKMVKHECNEDIVATLKEIKKDTKPCPKCGTGIFKISGCNDMFCVSCQTGFNWATGKIITKGLHNPEATRWMRENGRAIGDSTPAELGECIDPINNNMEFYTWMYNYGSGYLSKNKQVYDTIIELTNQVRHISEVVLHRFRDNYQTKTQDLSVDIRKYKKQQMFNSEFSNIINLLIEVVRTVLNNIREIIKIRDLGYNSVVRIKDQLDLVPKIVDECNIKFEDVKNCFNSKRKGKFVITTNVKKFIYELHYR
jgi:hypothetical protein